VGNSTFSRRDSHAPPLLLAQNPTVHLPSIELFLRECPEARMYVDPFPTSLFKRPVFSCL
jgi:hypothetical protein